MGPEPIADILTGHSSASATSRHTNTIELLGPELSTAVRAVRSEYAVPCIKLVDRYAIRRGGVGAVIPGLSFGIPASFGVNASLSGARCGHDNSARSGC